MGTMKYPRGSEWRRWDLHVHTPYSYLNNQFGSNFDDYAKEVFKKAVANEIAVIGITDYFLIEGYKKLKELQGDRQRLHKLLGDTQIAEKAQQILLLPNIEFRLNILVDGNRVNFHTIFSDDVSVRMIEEDFLRVLKFTSESSAGGQDERHSITKENLESLGKKLKKQHSKFQCDTDIKVGMTHAVVAHEDITKVLEEQHSRFKNRYIFVVPADEDLPKCSWDGQGHHSRKILIQKAHMLFSANPATREFALGLKHETPLDFEKEFGRLKPCIHGSDAHSYDTLFEPDRSRYQWIKADPTFQGLRQLLHVPSDRVYIGESQPFLASEKERATKYIDSVRFERVGSKDAKNVWFDGEVQLNHGLVAVIGNKGSGKSALADILALLGNTSNGGHFSFLRDERFLNKKEKLGSKFRAILTWYSGLRAARGLDEPVDIAGLELLKYIPQNFLEDVCSELKQGRRSSFYAELMEVIFSHVADAERLGKESLSELIDYVTQEKEEHIRHFTEKLELINGEIHKCEDKLSPDHKRSLEAQLEQRIKELEAHDNSEPDVVAEPSRVSEKTVSTDEASKELAGLVALWEGLEKDILTAEKNRNRATLQITAAERLLARIDNLERQIADFHSDSTEDSSVLGVDTKQLVELKANRVPITAAKEKATDQKRELGTALDESVEGSLTQKLKDIKAKTEEARAKLDKPNREYQEYCRLHAEWEKRRVAIVGSETMPDSVSGLRSKLSELENVPTKIDELKEQRFTLVREILKVKWQLLEVYRRLYLPVQKFINEHPVAREQKALEFAAKFNVDGFEQGFLDFIHKGKKGSFQGEDGIKRLHDIVESSDLDTHAGIKSFLASMQNHLEKDKRGGVDAVVQVSDQLVKGTSPRDLYDFLYGLSYIEPQFELRWQGKSLDELSQGERGSLLLVFYLLIDKRDVPLIIDQPEENLDNQSVVSMLVPAIKYAKERRQVVIVTHNPNLAVVCDADQIIHAQLNRPAGNSITYTSGAIEEPDITQLIVDVLEGTKPAFDMRDARYEVLETKQHN